MPITAQPIAGAERYPKIRRHSFADVLREQRRSRPDKLAVVDGEHRFTWSQLDARVNRLCNALTTRGIGPGDRVLWLGQNSVKLFELLLACAKLGAIVCPANWRMSIPEINRTIADFDPKIVFWQETEVGAAARASRAELPPERMWCQHDGTDHDCFEQWLNAAEDVDPDLDIDPDSPLLAIYTAAFDGRPAAALLAHTGLLLQGMITAQAHAMDEHSCFLASGPMFHIGVFMGLFGVYTRGGQAVVVPRVDAAEIMELIAREKITHGYLPQVTALQIQELNLAGKHDLSSLFENGDPGTWKATTVSPPSAPMSRMAGGYGQTEVTGHVCTLWMGGTGAGRPHPFAQMTILDDDGQEAAPGVAGEIAVRGPVVMCGYWNRPEENARRSREGWHRTRDLGMRRPDGSVTFIGPKTTMIKSGVENIYPTEVESCLLSHPDVAAACVIGVPDPQWDQNVKAIIVLNAGAKPSPDDLLLHCRANMASYKKPKLWEFVDELPRLPSGFVDREAADRTYGGGGYPSLGKAAG